jgi:hypothetical protein
MKWTRRIADYRSGDKNDLAPCPIKPESPYADAFVAWIRALFAV